MLEECINMCIFFFFIHRKSKTFKKKKNKFKMNLNLSLSILLLAIGNLVSAGYPCLNFSDWIKFKSSFSTKYIDYSANSYEIKFSDLNNQNIA